jgi:hypothetical protein
MAAESSWALRDDSDHLTTGEALTGAEAAVNAEE